MTPLAIQMPSNVINQIVSSLLSVRMCIHGWGAEVEVDKATREEMARLKGVNPNSLRSKLLYLPPQYKHQIGTARSRLSTAWDLRTLCWQVGGWKVIPSARFMSLQEEMVDFVRNYTATAADVSTHYDEIKAEVMKDTGPLFDPAEFPLDADDMRSRYYVEFLEQPIPATSDIRITGLSEAAHETIKRSLQTQYATMLDGAIGDAVKRITELVQKMAARVKEPEQDGRQYKGLIESAEKTLDSLSHLNLTGDRRLTDIIRAAKTTLTSFAPDTIRDEVTVRRAIAKDCSQIEAALAAFSAT